jgi:hypothetical protein
VEHPNGMKLFPDMSIISYSFVALYFQLRYEIPFWGQRKFYMEPIHVIEDIKRVTIMDLRKKRRQLRYEVKKGLKLTGDDNVQSVISKAEKTLKSKLIGGCLRRIRFFLTNAKR